MFENYKDCLFNNKTVYRSQERFRSYYHDVYTEEVNKIALSSNDDKRLQTPDRITTYPYWNKWNDDDKWVNEYKNDKLWWLR